MLRNFILTLFVFISSTTANAGLEIYPKRILLEPGQRSFEINLKNSSDKDSFSYRILWRQIQYGTDGRVLKSENNTHEGYITPPASPMIRYAPRQVVLKPGEKQKVRVFLRRPKKLEDGEYRSHLLFEEQANVGKAQTQVSDQGMAINLFYAVGMSIPVIVRQGKGEPQVSVEDTQLNEGASNGASMTVSLSRSGNYSSRTAIRLMQQIDGEEVLVGERSFTPLYTDADKYDLRIDLNESYRKGLPMTLDMTYLMRSDKEMTQRLAISP